MFQIQAQMKKRHKVDEILSFLHKCKQKILEQVMKK